MSYILGLVCGSCPSLGKRLMNQIVPAISLKA